MSVKSGLMFLQHIRRTQMADELRARPGNLDLITLVEVGKTAGFDFTVDELRIAFRQDWGLRWLKSLHTPKD